MNEDYLAHYGVLGMRWGVRKNPGRAYEKATKKFNKLSSKSDRAMDKSASHRRKGERTAAIGMGSKSRARHTRLAGKYKRSAARSAESASKWLKSMEKAFQNTEYSKLDSDLVSRGEMLTERYRTLRVV